MVYMHTSLHYTMVTKSDGRCQPLSCPLSGSLDVYIVLLLSTTSHKPVLFRYSTEHINTNILHTLTHFFTLIYYEHTWTTQ